MRVILAPGETPGGPWAAPERASGAACDPLTDIYSFGAILYHLLTGNAPGNHDISAFRRDLMRAEQAATAEANGDGPATLKLCSGLRRLALHCLDGDPERRCQRMQTVVMELKLLSLTVRQADPELTARRDRAEAALRAEVAALRAAVLPRVDAIECRLAELDRGVEELRAEVAVASSEKNRLRCDVESQASTIASLNSALCQTDDMVERVVEALDGLQTLFLERSVQRAVGNS